MFNSVMFGLRKPLGSLEKVSTSKDTKETKKAEAPKKSFWPIKNANPKEHGIFDIFNPLFGKPRKISGQAVDIETLNRHGIRNGQENNPNGAAQVAGNKNTKVSVEGGYLGRPDKIIIKDSTNGQPNTYVYRYDQSRHRANNEKTPLCKINGYNIYGTGQRYVLESVTNSKGEDIMRHDHNEEYELVFNRKEAEATGEYVYNLIQTKDMEGSNQSSIYYNKRRG